jgi:hypothetical protein
MKPLCIYHGACDDGFAAAWAVNAAFKRRWDEVPDFYAGVYQKEPPPHEDRDVIFVDFSYKRPVLDQIAKSARSVLVLDHHKTAAEDLADLPFPERVTWCPWKDGSGAKYVDYLKLSEPNFYAIFDMERSGAALAWDYFMGGERPDFIEYVQDRDLWRKQLSGGDEFTIALRSYPQDFEVWDKLVAAGAHALIHEGGSIQRYYRLRVEEIKRSAYKATLAGAPIWIANAPYFAASEVAGELCERDGAAFGACYFEAEGGRFQYSLRSRGDFDVSAVARQFGGGGHKAAAGFSAVSLAHSY